MCLIGRSSNTTFPCYSHSQHLEAKQFPHYPGDLSPHDLRRTAITEALDSGLTYRQVQMMSKHKDPKTVMRYNHGRENMDQNAVNFLDYSEDE